MKEPFYHLDYTSGECLFKIFLNEILIIDNLEGLKSPAGNMLLNTYLYNKGEQNIRFEVYPKKGQSNFNDNSFIEIYLYVADQSKQFQDKEDIIPRGTKLPSSLLKNEDKFATPPISWIVNFEADLPYSLERNWEKGQNILNINDYENLVVGSFTEIYQLAKEGNAVKLYDLMKENFHRTTVTYYEKVNGAENTVRIFEQLIKKQSIGGHIYHLQDLDFGKVRVYGNNKIADILRPDGNTILFFKKDKNDESGVSIDLKLFIPQGEVNLLKVL